MRPVERGALPNDDQGNPKTFTKYAQARRDLIDRMGEYCSYCEMHLDASLAIEHVQPKSLNPQLELDWGNFLLACTNCNSTKGNKAVVITDYFWPDHDNTARAYIYDEGGKIVANPDLTTAQQERAEKMIDLVGLDKNPGNAPAASDRRWANRLEAWGMARRALEHVQSLPFDVMREQVVDTAVAKGFWSIWMTIFHDDPLMRTRLINGFKGTSATSFDPDANLIPRPDGDL
jgi:uncharacterized protein (TIGR02646 family)